MSSTKFARPHRPSVEELAQGVLAGNRALLGRAITLVESNAAKDQEASRALISKLLPHSGNAVRIGITGVPGAGKSSFIEAFGTYLCKKGFKVAVLAIDPSSSVSRGSIMGDKTRMEELSGEENAFIRPSPSGGSLGGVARKTRETMIACEAAGFDIILIETVGVGQSETTVRSMVDIFMLLLITGAGDDLQGIKRGIMELADILVVTKDDGDQPPARGGPLPGTENGAPLPAKPHPRLDSLRPHLLLPGRGADWTPLKKRSSASGTA